MEKDDNVQANNDSTNNDITPQELDLLNSSLDSSENGADLNLRRSELDNTDQEGDLLNEKSMADDISGEELDVPGAENDDAMEDIGSEDEENNSYSLADTD